MLDGLPPATSHQPLTTIPKTRRFLVTDKAIAWIDDEIAALKEAGLFNRIRTIDSPMDGHVTIDGRSLLNFCANNYLGLANHPRLRTAVKEAVDQYGVGPGAVRTIAGTMSLHIALEEKLAAFKRAEACITLQSGFTANLATIPALVGKGDIIFSDELNHASIIDGSRLSRAGVVRYAHNDVDDLRQKIAQTTEYGRRLIVTDGVFSMDGIVADLKGVCDLADKYEALVMVDECHAAGFIGKTGRGSVEHCGVTGRVDIITGTLGKALGGAMGGYTSARKEIVELLRQRSRPYLFSNSLAPCIVGASIKVIDLLSASTELRDRLEKNVDRFRSGIEALGFKTRGAGAAIVPVMLGDAKLSQMMADALLDEGIYVIGFFYPVVPKDTARIRVQLSAGHTDAHIDAALAAFAKVGKELGVI
jgi:glycine C-acetyltransferase